MNIFILNNPEESCGVHQYGKRFGNIASKSKKYNFIYQEVTSALEFISKCNEYKPKGIIYNYLSGTMPWLNGELIQRYRELGIKQYTIVHNSYYHGFDYYLHQNPYHPHEDDRNFALARPLFEYTQSQTKRNDDTLHIGSFGFGLTCKYTDQICKIINDQLSYRKVQINLHLTQAHFCPNEDTIVKIKEDCLKVITCDNIKLNMTNDFLTTNQMLDFLASNDLNMFFYEKYNHYNGISSSVDYALSVKKPIAICRSNMFSHIWDVQPSICVENNSLLNIINNGFSPLEEKYNSWTHEKFIDKLETIIKKTFEV